MIFKKQTKNSKSPIAVLFFFFLIAIFFIGRNYIRGSIFVKYAAEASLFAARPVFVLKNKITGALDGAFSYFKFKKDLSDLNQKLSEENLNLKVENYRVKVLENKNKQLLKILNGEDGGYSARQIYAAEIIFKPPIADFDSFIINGGLKNGFKKGMKAVFERGVILGEIEDVYNKTSKVKLYSAYGNKISVYFENSLFSAMASGRGGENFEIILPKNSEVAEGENIFYSGTNFALGKAEKIIKNESEPFQKIYFRYPINLSEIYFVGIIAEQQ